MIEQIAHFFQHYKDLEKGKWVSIVRWLDAREAEGLILEGIARAKGKKVGVKAKSTTKPKTKAASVKKAKPVKRPRKK